jgi:hypothetical protein
VLNITLTMIQSPQAVNAPDCCFHVRNECLHLATLMETSKVGHFVIESICLRCCNSLFSNIIVDVPTVCILLCFVWFYVSFVPG